jgi:hypothetical protein
MKKNIKSKIKFSNGELRTQLVRVFALGFIDV